MISSDGRSTAHQQLGHLNGIRGSTFSKIIAHAPERQPIVKGQVFTNPAHEHVILSAARQRQRVQSRVKIVQHRDTGKLVKQFASLINRELSFGLDQDAFAVAVRYRLAHAGGAKCGWNRH